MNRYHCRMSGELGTYTIVVGNMGDRNDLNLWWEGGSLVERVAAVCNNTIVVVHSVGPVYFTWSNHPNVTAIIYAGAPGEQTGPAIVDVIYGAYNPSGRLPFSIADVSTCFLFIFQVLTAFIAEGGRIWDVYRLRWPWLPGCIYSFHCYPGQHN